VGDLLLRAKFRRVLFIASTTISEFWRDNRGLAESRFGLLKPTVIDVDENLAKRAGHFLKGTGGRNAMDALVVAAAERVRAAFIYTSDVDDIEALLLEAADWPCRVVAY
jgi:hypothetical protein